MLAHWYWCFYSQQWPSCCYQSDPVNLYNVLVLYSNNNNKRFIAGDIGYQQDNKSWPGPKKSPVTKTTELKIMFSQVGLAIFACVELLIFCIVG